jgi:cytochrome bd-type quinol oxidase subunit 2
MTDPALPTPEADAAKRDETSLRTAGQRRVNIIWEMTQAFIAAVVTLATLLAAVTLVLKDQKAEAAFLLLSNAFFLVIGFYFGRTNHARTGGVGGNVAQFDR